MKKLLNKLKLLTKTKSSNDVAQLEEIKRKASRTLFYTVFGTILPFIIGSIILILFTKFKDLTTFITDGTFCLFAAALLTSAMYLLNENNDSISKKWDRRVQKYSQPIWIIVAIVYGLIFAKDKLPIKEEINQTFLWIISIVCFLFSIWALYRALYIDGLQFPPKADASIQRKDEIADIVNDLN